jgi:hypothetical protein
LASASIAPSATIIHSTIGGSYGVADDVRGRHEVEDRTTLARRVVEPHVPFHTEWLGKHGSHRQQLADWITHRENKRFLRAISNRVWGLLFGRPWVDPVDSIPDPDEPGNLV